MMFELSQYSDAALFLLRLVIAAIFLHHGLPKFKKAQMMAQGLGMPAGAVVLLGFAEVASAIAMALGAYVQIAALLFVVVILGALYYKLAKWHVPFSAMDKTGTEFDLILLAANLFLAANGGGSIGIQ